MAKWQRILATLLAMVAASFVAGLRWRSAFDARLPSYLGGLVGGLTAILDWEFL